MKSKYLLLSLLYFCFMLSFPTQAQIITTIAGNGSGGSYSGEGGSALLATLPLPYDLVVDDFGNIFLSAPTYRIHKIDASGIITTIAGTGTHGYGGDGGPATAALIWGCRGISLNESGQLYIADDFQNLRVRKMDLVPGGIINTVAGIGTLGSSGDGGPATAAEFNYIYDVCADVAGNVYITDVYNRRIRKVDTLTGIITTIAGDGTMGFSGDSGPATLAQLKVPYSVVADDMGNLYIGDYTRVRKVDPNGIITTVTGSGVNGYSGDGGPATAAEISNPYQLAVDGAGNLYIAAIVIRKIDASTGIISTVAGLPSVGLFGGDGGPATAAYLNQPMGVSVDAAGNIYIADRGNNRIRKVDVGNHIPAFPPSAVHTITVCEGSAANSINSLLEVSDVDAAQTMTWVLMAGPVHGTVGGFSTTAPGTGGVVVPAGLTYTPTPGYAGTDSFRVKIHDGTSAVRTMIYVNITPLPHAGTITGMDTLCPGDVTLFSDTAAGGIWSSTNTGVATITGLGSVTAVATGTTTISYTVANSCDTIAATFTLVVRPLAVAGTIMGTDSICAEDTALLTDAVTGGVWSSSDTAIAIVTGTGSVMGITTGSAVISYTVTNPCNTAVAVHPVFIRQLAVAGTITGTDSICPGDTVLFTDAITGGIWSSSNTAIATVTGTGYVTGAASGTATITYTVSNICNTATAVYAVVVRPATDCETGIDKTGNGAAIKIYPNPSAGSITVSLPQTGGTAAIEVMDIIGRTIQTTNTKANTITLHDIPAGTYMVKVMLNGAVYREKVVVVR